MYCIEKKDQFIVFTTKDSLQVMKIFVVFAMLTVFIVSSCVGFSQQSSTRKSNGTPKIGMGLLDFLGGATKKGSASTTAADYADNVMTTYGRYPMTISHGKGCKLYDTEGKEYLDFAAGIATCCLGHAHPALKKAVSEQMDRVHHCSNLYFIPEQGQLAKWLVQNSCADKVTDQLTPHYLIYNLPHLTTYCMILLISTCIAQPPSFPFLF